MNDEYCFRLLDADNQPIDEMTMVCLDDEAALLLGERFGQRHPVEVWARDRLVGLIPSASRVEPAPSAPVAAAPAPSRRRFKPFWSGGWRRGAREL